MKTGRAALLSLALVAAAATSRAEPSDLDKQAAQSLFESARRLMKEKRYPEACPLFEQSQKLDPGGGTLLNLAVCHERVGRIATAYAEYNEALSLAIAAGRSDRQKTASDAIAALGPRLPRLRIAVPSLPEGAAVTLDGQPVSKNIWNISTPVDPGQHVIAARAAGYEPYQTTVQLKEGESIDAAVPPLKPEALPAPSPPPASAPPATAPVEPALSASHRPLFEVAQGPGPRCADPSSPGCGRRRMLERSEAPPLKMAMGVIAITAGFTALSTGIGAAIESKLASCAPAERRCDSQADLERARTARTLALINTLSLGVTAASGVAYFMIPDRKVQLDFGLAPSGWQVALTGRLP